MLPVAVDPSCPLCGRSGPLQMEAHHLRTRRTDRNATEMVCHECHKTIHGLFTHQDLRDPRLGLDSLEGLLESEGVRKALGFIRKIPAGATFKMKQSGHRKGKR